MANVENAPSSKSAQRKIPGAVYTKLKFSRSEITGRPVGFVFQDFKKAQGWIRGVRADSDCPKKICVVDEKLSGEILANTLYYCTLIPMAEKSGYVVIEATPVQFKATVHTSYIKNTIYRVEVKFGNKTVYFNPFDGKKDSVKDIGVCKSLLERRVDIENQTQVVEDFERAANHLLRLMHNDRYPRKRA